MVRKVLIQHNSLITARYEMSAAEKNITYMLLAQLGQNDPVDSIYYISISDMEKLTGRALKHKQIKKATEKLLLRLYTIWEGGDLLQVCMISSARYIKGAGKIAIRIDPEIRPYLFNLKNNFTKFGFYVVMGLKSKYSKRIYEMLSQFRSTSVMHVSVEELKSRLWLLDPETKHERYTGWAMFRDKVLKVAEQELKAHGDIYFTYVAKKVGRKFTDLEFNIRKASTLPACIPATLREPEEPSRYYERLIGDYRLSAWQAKLIVEQLAEKEIGKTLYDIQLRKVNNELKNLGGFTAQTFENKYQLGLMGNKS